MKLVELEGHWVNVDQICVIRREPDDSETTFRSEVVLANQTVRLRMRPEEVVRAVESVVGR